MEIETIQRFWHYVKLGGINDCWEWLGAKDKNGYGEFWFPYRKKHTRAHQASWIINFGDIPIGSSVCHTCDNPSCVNINHLYLGNQKENVHDREIRGRSNRRFLYGTDHPQHGTNSKFHKLTEEQVIEIRKLKTSGNYTLREIAKKFGVSSGLINNIYHGRKWAWLKEK